MAKMIKIFEVPFIESRLNDYLFHSSPYSEYDNKQNFVKHLINSEEEIDTLASAYKLIYPEWKVNMIKKLNKYLIDNGAEIGEEVMLDDE
jgi:hypothetical protein